MGKILSSIIFYSLCTNYLLGWMQLKSQILITFPCPCSMQTLKYHHSTPFFLIKLFICICCYYCSTWHKLSSQYIDHLQCVEHHTVLAWKDWRLKFMKNSDPIKLHILSTVNKRGCGRSHWRIPGQNLTSLESVAKLSLPSVKPGLKLYASALYSFAQMNQTWHFVIFLLFVPLHQTHFSCNSCLWTDNNNMRI